MSSIFDIINVPFGYVLRGCNWLVGNQYILALLLFAIIIEVILLPFSIKQQKNSIKQARLRPKEMAIRKKYAGRNDQPTQQKMTQEIQELYQQEGFNPMSGCLPMLIQFPIIIALYNIVMSPLKYICGLSEDMINQAIEIVNSFPAYAETKFTAARNIDLMSAIKNILTETPDAFNSIEGFAEKIPNVDALPNLTMFWGHIDLGSIPSFTNFNWLLLIPVLTFVVYFLSMKINRKLSFQPMSNDKATGCTNNVMDIMMPLMSVFISFGVPAAIGVYWIFKSILGVIKQWILKKAMPFPEFSEEDYKAAEKEMNARADKKPVQKSGKVVRSLHHIDDEDFADTAEKARKHREALEAQEAAEAEEKASKAKSSMLGGASLKKDDKPERKEKKKKAKKGMDEYRESIEKSMTDQPKEDTNDENKTDGEES